MFICSLFFIFITNSVYSQNINVPLSNYLNGFNLILVKSEISCEKYIRNEVNIIYAANGKFYVNTIIRTNDFKENIDTTIILNKLQINEVTRFINDVRMKKPLRDSPQTIKFAGTWNDIEITITDSGVDYFLDGMKIESDGEKKFKFSEKSTYSLHKYLSAIPSMPRGVL